ncbi:DUF6263 family protein [Carboxylicivirga sp. RSCT41]|uniref:DUF6263 family protein n=1 Tax=Carboxylicivirga agarovorans TaxID=3417570 RepID=UPI003D347A1E
MKRLTKVLLFTAAILLSLNVTAQKALRYNLKVGQTYHLKQSTIQSIEQNVAGMSQNVKTTMGGDITVTVKEKNGNVYTSEVVFKSMLFKLEGPMMNMAYDSNDADADKTNPLNKTFDLMVGHLFQVKFDDRGNIQEVKGFETISEKVVEAFSDNPQQAEMMKKQLANQFSNESMKGNLSNMFIIYPEEKVKVGSKWSNNKSIISPFEINNQYDFNVDEMNKEEVNLSGKGVMATKEGQTVQQMGMTQHINLDGDFDFKAKVNAKSGWPIEIKINQNLDGNVAVESPQLPAPMEIPMKITGELTYTGM